jgi:putative (di)nucleoside polyphosphate hydrolase
MPRDAQNSGKRPVLSAPSHLARPTGWTYEFPAYDGAALAPPRQVSRPAVSQKWFALRYTGRDDEIDPLTPRNAGSRPIRPVALERLDRVADLVVPFRREVYKAVASAFARFAAMPRPLF